MTTNVRRLVPGDIAAFGAALTYARDENERWLPHRRLMSESITVVLAATVMYDFIVSPTFCGFCFAKPLFVAHLEMHGDRPEDGLVTPYLDESSDIDVTLDAP